MFLWINNFKKKMPKNKQKIAKKKKMTKKK